MGEAGRERRVAHRQGHQSPHPRRLPSVANLAPLSGGAFFVQCCRILDTATWGEAMVVEETGCCDRRAIDALAELPEHEREGWQRGNRLGCASCAALSRHRAGDGTGSPQVGLSRSPGSAWLAPALLHVSQARAARSPSLRWLVLPPAAFAALLGPRERKKGANSRTPAVFNHPRVLPRKVIAALGQRLRAAW